MAVTSSQQTPPGAPSSEAVIRRPGPGGLWWVEPALVIIVLGSFALYALWRVLEGVHYYKEPYLSPFYSPLVLLPWWPFSPAVLIMWAPLGFRLTCYYYRKAYYRSFFWHPPACAVAEGRGPGYKGETAFPFILQNIHRYFLYAAVVVLAFLWWDTIHAFNFGGRFGIGLGSLVLLLNVILLTGYTFSCHSLRHLIGGGLDCFSCAKVRYSLWSGVSVLNKRHMQWAWVSLVTVALADLYVRLVASGVINDPRIL